MSGETASGAVLRGRPPGAKNKRTRALDELIRSTFGDGYDPVVDMLIAARTGRLPTYTEDGCLDKNLTAAAVLDVDQRNSLLKEATKYIRPALKAVEHSGDVNMQATTQLLLPGSAPDLAAWGQLVVLNAEQCSKAELPAILDLGPEDFTDETEEGEER